MSVTNGWVTALDLDFTAQTNQTFTSDGTYNIAGLTWTKGNSANEATHASIVNGSGLNFQPGSTSDYNGATRTLPYMWLPFTQIFPTALDWETKIRLYVSIGTDNMATTYDNEVIGFDSNNTNLYFVMKRGYGLSATQGGASLFSVGGNNGNNFFTDTYTVSSNNANGKTYCIETNLLFTQVITYKYNTQLAAGVAFPALGSFIPSVILYLIAGSTATPGSTPQQLYSISSFSNTSMGVVLGAHRAGSGTSLSTYFQRIRVDYKV